MEHLHPPPMVQFLSGIKCTSTSGMTLGRILSVICLHLPRLLVNSLLFQAFITGWHPATLFGFPFLPSLSFNIIAWRSEARVWTQVPMFEFGLWNLLNSVTVDNQIASPHQNKDISSDYQRRAL